MRGADIIAQTLANAGVKVIFTLSGNQIMPIFDACIDVGIRLIHVRHEAAAVYMAEGYAQITGQPGIALVTAAPGFANALTPLFTARQSESPVVLLSGDSPVAKDGAGAFQELDQVSISKTLTKLSRRSLGPDSLAGDIVDALRVARDGRPGPVHLALPFDVIQAAADPATVPAADDFNNTPPQPDERALADVIETLNHAERPLILTGPSLNRSRAASLTATLENALSVPVVAMESPRGLNDPCLGDVASLLARADVVLSLGKNIDFTLGFGASAVIGDDCHCIIIDSDEDVLDRGRRALGPRLHVALLADARVCGETMVQLALDTDTRTAAANRDDWRRHCAERLAARPPLVRESSGGATAEWMTAVDVSTSIQTHLDAADDPILIIDGGEAGQWAQACISAPTRVINGPAGAIGGCLCYAIAAKIARPDATVIVFMGDGTAGFHFSEFETAHRYGVNFTAVIAHDARWNAEYQIQLRDYGADRLYECELDPTRYDIAAAGFGCHGEHATSPSELDDALSRALGSGLPACVVAQIEGLPAPTMKPKQA